MAEKKEASVARQAYGAASKALRENHKAEFESLLDTAYAELGVESPKSKARRRAKDALEARKAAKVAALEAQLAALKGEVGE